MPDNLNGKNRRIKDPFLLIPLPVLISDAYRGLSASAVKLLVDIASQYRGANNGALVACYSEMKKRGWRSPVTLRRALLELMDAGMIERTRHGGMNMGPSFYAVTWQKIDECLDKNQRRRHDAKPTKVASGLWKGRTPSLPKDRKVAAS